MRISYFWSAAFLLRRNMLWLLLVVNGLGTLYGFQWYGWQIIHTIKQQAPWLVLFVPDSPTASLFFTVAIAYLLHDQYKQKQRSGTIYVTVRAIVEAMAVITSIKYGIWAVAMIWLGTVQGDPFQWQHAMLITSHIGMAVEALLYARFLTYRSIHLVVIALWTLSNDYIDYTYGVFPSLSFPGVTELLPAIRNYTVMLSIFSIACAYGGLWQRKLDHR